MISWQKLVDHRSETIAIIGEVTLDRLSTRFGNVSPNKALFFISCTIKGYHRYQIQKFKAEHVPYDIDNINPNKIIHWYVFSLANS
jgi:hypothetical protein